MIVSVLILTHNEAINLPRCLTSLAWCDDIIIVDSGSTDSTIEIAESHQAKILKRPFDNFANQRNFGLDFGEPRHDWILHLDADEVVTPEFVELLAATVPIDGIDAYMVPSKTMFFDKWIKHAGMWPTYQARLGHAQRLRFVQVGHGQREDLPPSRVGVFDEAYLHFSFSHGLRAWLIKHVRYAQDEANEVLAARSKNIALSSPTINGFKETKVGLRRHLKSASNRLPLILRPFARFFYVYLLKQGFRDGFLGLFYSFMLSVYEGMIAVLAYEMILDQSKNFVIPDGLSSSARIRRRSQLANDKKQDNSL